jgi:predicted ATPase
MRVSRFVPYPQDAEDLGLGKIDMARFGRVVVLAGPNGAGKTRILTLLKKSLDSLKHGSVLRDAQIAGNLTQYSQRLRQFRENDPQWKVHNQLLEQMQRLHHLRSSMKFEPSSEIGQVQFAEFSTRGIQSLHSDVSIGQIERQVDLLKTSLGTSSVRENGSSLLYLHYIEDRYFNATHPKIAASDQAKRDAEVRKKELDELIEKLLAGAKLERNLDGKIMINGRSRLNEELSDGQKALLVVAATLHAQRVNLDQAILLIDEPELHLHPDAQIEYVDRLIDATPNGQVWIATHSVHILSHVDPDSLWFVEGGDVRWAGTKPELVLSRLVGDEDRIGRLHRFVQLPAIHAMQRFAAECLLAPTIVSTGPEDRQSQQIRKIIEKMAARPLRVLDYGAGRGRILAALGELADLQQSIDYRGYEGFDSEAREECARAISEGYGITLEDAANRVYADEDSLRTSINPGSVHIIVMCNVLHEVPPTDWAKLFTGLFSHCLHPEGYLLIVEDMHIPHGENPHRYGFILLDTEQLQTLFDADREDPEQFRSVADGDRLKAHLVRADLVAKVGPGTLRAALQRRHESAKREIRRLRGEPASFAKGRLLGLYTMLLANASLALEDLT